MFLYRHPVLEGWIQVRLDKQAKEEHHSTGRTSGAGRAAGTETSEVRVPETVSSSEKIRSQLVSDEDGNHLDGVRTILCM